MLKFGEWLSWQYDRSLNIDRCLLPCFPLFGLWPWLSGSLLMRAKVKCLGMPCQQCIQAISWGTSCLHMSASILVGICIFLRPPSRDTGSNLLLQEKLQTGGLSLRIKTRLTQAFPLPHTPRGSSLLWAQLALHIPSLRRKLINARAGDSFHKRFLSLFQIFYYLKIYLQTHDVPKRIV